MSTDLATLTARARARRSLPSPERRRAIRTEAGATQAELAAALGVSRSLGGMWELDLRAPSGETLIRYLDALVALQEAASP